MEFFAGLDILLRENIDSSVEYVHFTIWRAGVINIARLIFFDIAVYHSVFTRPKKIFPPVRLLFGFGNRPPFIFNDARVSRYSLLSKHPKAGARTLHYKLVYSRLKNSFDFLHIFLQYQKMFAYALFIRKAANPKKGRRLNVLISFPDLLRSCTMAPEHLPLNNEENFHHSSHRVSIIPATLFLCTPWDILSTSILPQ